MIELKMNPMLAIDSYKLGHMTMYPEGTELVYCNLTARNFEHLKKTLPNDFQFFNDKAVVFGLSGAVQEINEIFKNNFFDKDFEELSEEFRQTIRPFIGDNDDTMIVENFRKLHELGYLPLVFKTLPEGSQVPANVPMMTWYNTHPDFAWLPNYLETFISAQVWKLITSATISKIYKNIFDYYGELTGVSKGVRLIQGHDFSARGMSSIYDAIRTGAGHLTSFIGSDTIGATKWIEKYYNPKGLIAVSVPATEHSVMCMGTKEKELDTYRRIMKKYPFGVVSIVSDTWDYWDLITNGTKALKEDILNRYYDSNGLAKVVLRPDSGNPVDIICGTKMEDDRTPQEKGSIKVLDEIFGSQKNDAGYKVLNEKVGLIYGDSITPIRAHNILKKLMKKGYASNNVVLGIGSFTYQYVTRDTLGMAIKATAAIIDGKVVKIFKEPKTDSGKRSAKGFMKVVKMNGDYVLVDNLENDDGGELKMMFRDGTFINLPTFDEIRERLTQQ